VIPVNRLILILTPVMTAAALIHAGTGHAEDPSLAIDIGTAGNSPTAIGDIENCLGVTAGDRFDVDVIIRDVTDLLAWEMSLDYDGAVLTVVDQDVKMFQGANEGSSPVDISAKLPDDSGSHSLSAFESSDPPSPDSGSGVLTRVTFEATADGETEIHLGQRDANDDGTLDRGTLLKDVNAEVIGDTNGDGFFDGESEPALVVVGDDCPDGYRVATLAGESEDEGGAQAWYVVGGVVAALAIVAGIALALLRRRGNRGSS
jgi:hypothetical protein